MSTPIFTYPNQILYGTAGLIAYITCIALIAGTIRCQSLLRSLRLPFFYFAYLALTSIWARYPEVTLEQLRFDSLFLSVFTLFYLLALNSTSTEITHLFISIIVPALLITITYYLVHPEATRLGANSSLFMAISIPYLLLGTKSSEKPTSIVLLSIACSLLFISMSRINTLIGIAGGFLLILWTSSGIRKSLFNTVKLLVILSSIATLLLTLEPTRELTLRAVSRFTPSDIQIFGVNIFPEGEDITRASIQRDSLPMYNENWLLGIGYMNFMPIFGESYDVVQYTATGREIRGESLHNSFLTWGLEGGLPCVAIVTLILWRYFTILGRKITTAPTIFEKHFFKACVIVMIQLLIFGLFHQLHQAFPFWMMLGIVYGLETGSRPPVSCVVL